MKGYSAFPKAPVTGVSPSDCLTSYLRDSLGESYPTAEVQSAFSTTLADRVVVHSEPGIGRQMP